jgi:hypothetical protein
MSPRCFRLSPFQLFVVLMPRAHALNQVPPKETATQLSFGLACVCCAHRVRNAHARAHVRARMICTCARATYVRVPRVRTCTCVRARTCVHVRARTCTYVHVRARTCTYVHVRARACTYVRARTCTYVYICAQNARVHKRDVSVVRACTLS